MTVDFVLVSPAVPENIGAAARAMNTMGFTRLRLVNPCDHLSDRARWLAHGSAGVLKRAEVFPALAEALAGVDLSIATTARFRKRRHEYYPAGRLPELLRAKGSTVLSVALVFGPEERGLSNRELKQCDLLSTIPMARAYPSLNLAQAVMVYAYLLSARRVPARSPGKVSADSAGQLGALKKWCEEVFPRIDIRRKSVIHGRILERLSALNAEDVRLAHFVRRKLDDWIRRAAKVL